MTDQASPDTVPDEVKTGVPVLDAEMGVQLGLAHTSDAHHGRRSSWIAVAIIIIGFVVGGVAMIPHPRWWLMWVGAGIVAVGAIIATFTNIFEDWY